jgi:tRNA(fMet)-specific endonuclease VapC
VAEIRVALEKGGTPIGPYDILIAATASANNATLVTHNTKEFGRIAGLVLVDWY